MKTKTQIQKALNKTKKAREIAKKQEDIPAILRTTKTINILNWVLK